MFLYVYNLLGELSVICHRKFNDFIKYLIWVKITWKYTIHCVLREYIYESRWEFAKVCLSNILQLIVSISYNLLGELSVICHRKFNDFIKYLIWVKITWKYTIHKILLYSDKQNRTKCIGRVFCTRYTF